MQDIRLAELFSKYGLKATFNLNSSLLAKEGSLVRDGVRISHNKVDPKDVRHIYAAHEVAAHTLTHPLLPSIEDEREITRQVEEDRLRLSELAGYEVRGFAYPGGGTNNDDRVAEIIKRTTGVRYCRTITSTHSFALQENLFRFNPTVYHHKEFDELFELGEKFLSLKTDEPAIFYIWGHAYEFDIADTWGRFEEFLQMISGKSDIYYGTNSEILLAGR
jgi:peptidoglycan/xylan/chitin deacetylase (PgdA/CDA1 family)